MRHSNPAGMQSLFEMQLADLAQDIACSRQYIKRAINHKFVVNRHTLFAYSLEKG
jgi:hypothetical protein